MKNTSLQLYRKGLPSFFSSHADTLIGFICLVAMKAWNMETKGGFSEDGTNINLFCQ